jgi:hypothetical protein
MVRTVPPPRPGQCTAWTTLGRAPDPAAHAPLRTTLGDAEVVSWPRPPGAPPAGPPAPRPPGTSGCATGPASASRSSRAPARRRDDRGVALPRRPRPAGSGGRHRRPAGARAARPLRTRAGSGRAAGAQLPPRPPRRRRGPHPGGRLFVKVVRPSALRALAERHRLLRAAGCPVRRRCSRTRTGGCCSRRCPGRRCAPGCARAPTRARAVRRSSSCSTCSRRRCAPCPRPRRGPTPCGTHAAVTAAALPDERARCRSSRTASARRSTTTGRRAGARRPVRGAAAAVGRPHQRAARRRHRRPGRRADDLACLLGPRARPGAARAGARADDPRARGAVAGRLRPPRRPGRPAGAHRRVSSSLATGPAPRAGGRVAELTRRRLDLAEQWLAAARGGPAPVRSRR